MNIVALETSCLPGSLALATDGTVVWEGTLLAHEKSAETLLARLDAGLQQRHWSVSAVQLVGVARGPGSFTGLRVGVTAAKILAYAAGCPVACVDTMQAIAAGVSGASGRMLVVIDAQRRGYYCQYFVAGSTDPLGRREIWPADRVLAEPDSTILAGPGLARLADRSLGRNVLPVEQWNPRASTVARLAWEAALRNDVVDPFHVVPDYGAMSAAEESLTRKT